MTKCSNDIIMIFNHLCASTFLHTVAHVHKQTHIHIHTHTCHIYEQAHIYIVTCHCCITSPDWNILSMLAGGLVSSSPEPSCHWWVCVCACVCVCVAHVVNRSSRQRAEQMVNYHHSDHHLASQPIRAIDRPPTITGFSRLVACLR